MARYIRFRPTAWHGHISMRVELYGCEGIVRFFLRKSITCSLFQFTPVEQVRYTINLHK